MTEWTFDRLTDLAHHEAHREVFKLLEALDGSELTGAEMVAMRVILRAAYDRKQAREVPPAPVVKLVRPRTRTRV